jgi:hypothetical protein
MADGFQASRLTSKAVFSTLETPYAISKGDGWPGESRKHYSV